MYFAFSNSIGIYVYELLVSMNFSKLKKYLKKKKKEKRHTPRMPPGWVYYGTAFILCELYL